MAKKGETQSLGFVNNKDDQPLLFPKWKVSYLNLP